MRFNDPDLKKIPIAYIISSDNKACIAALLSELVYDDLNEIKSFCSEYPQTKLIRMYLKKDVEAVLIQINNSLYLCFRGTELTKTDLKYGIEISTKEFCGTRALRGYANAIEHAADRIIADLKKHHRNDTKLYFCGHSMGGSLAILMSLIYRPYAMYTFGSPRVFADHKFNKDHKFENHYNYKNAGDMVSYYPPKFLGYKDIGHCIWFYKFYWFLRPHYMRTYLEHILREQLKID